MILINIKMFRDFMFYFALPLYYQIMPIDQYMHTALLINNVKKLYFGYYYAELNSIESNVCQIMNN
jgi:hypothetical protein